jgi:hypothetical protein
MRNLSGILGIAIALVALTGCEPNELYPAGGVPFSSGNSGGTSTAPQTAPQNLAPIIDNPDESHEDFDYIWAESESEAIRKCQQLTEQNKVIYVKVQRASKNSKRYECHWRT